MKRIHTLIVGMSPEIGGIETLIIRLIREMDKSRFQFDILTFCPKCAYEDELKSLGCQVFHATRRGKNPIKNYIDQRKFFLSHRDIYDYVWLHLSSASDLNTILLTKKYTKAKVICHCHGTSFDSKPGLIRKMHNFLHFIHQKRLVKNTDLYFACSKLAGKWLYGDIGSKLTIIPNGIDLPKFSFNQQTRDAMRKVLGVDGKIVLGNVGRLAEEKNQAFLLDIFAAFLKKEPGSKLVIAGTGELEADLKQKAQELGISGDVMFLGFRHDIEDLLQAFDAFVLPSIYEGLPITIIEAQAGGLPCVISDTITREVAVTELVHFMPLSKPPQDWANEILAALINERSSPIYKERMEQSGYSIYTTIEHLSDIFGGKI